MDPSKEELFVSIIMPAYNVEKYIAASIESVMNQTFKNWELIIIDDGSTDGTATVIHSFIALDNRIKYLYQENARQAKARNNGILHAKGNLLAFLDSDDLWLPTKLEKSLQFFDLNKYDLLFTNSYISSDANIDVSSTSYETMHVTAQEYLNRSAIPLFLSYNRIPTLTVILKKEVMEKVGFFDEKSVPIEDYDLWLRLLISGCNFVAIAEPLSIYRVHSASSTASDRTPSNFIIKSIVKNFTSEELIALNAKPYLKKWLILWTRFYLNKNNTEEYIHFLNYFQCKTKSILILLYFYKLLNCKIILKLIITELKKI